MKKVGYLAAVIIVLIWCMTRREFAEGAAASGGGAGRLGYTGGLKRGPIGPARFHALAFPNLLTCPTSPPYEQ